MSTRAYKLIEIKTEKEPTFNFSNDRRLYSIVEDNEGILTIQREGAEKELIKVLKELKGLKGNPQEKSDELQYYKKVLIKIIADCGDEEYAEYYYY